MKIFTSGQIREIDDYTIRYEPVASVDLMERAAGQLFNWYVSKFERAHRIFVFVGPGNNGGDGLALARMLFTARYDVDVHYLKFSDKTSPDWDKNMSRLEAETHVPFNIITERNQFPLISENDIIIDAIFGSGLTRPAAGLAANIIMEINNSFCKKIAVDIPSGLFGEDNSSNNSGSIVCADYTLSFQFPKLSFMFPENGKYTGEWVVLPIGLDRNAINSTLSPYSLVESFDVLPLLKTRDRFAHKGNFGHGLLISGSSGKTGAAVLGALAALRSGIGLLTCHVPSAAGIVINSSVPEAMVSHDRSGEYISQIGPTDSYSAVGVGPGLGTDIATQDAFHRLLLECKKPMVIDADALNILSQNKDWYKFLNNAMILTPHPKEFERLAGKSANGFERLSRQILFSTSHKCIVILKGANTTVTTGSGAVFFNSTGNPGMATAGSGDVLTGILLSLLAQGYDPANAAIAGVFLHGLAGDIAAEEGSYESLIASDIINCLGKAFNRTRETEI
jgi:hydroxyethylthiazole kinase-like uncharacterized protein yjeF